MKTLNDFNFNSLKALMRVDFNVPVDDQMNITDDTRIRAAIPSIKKILVDGGSVVLMSHRGRPKGVDLSMSLNFLTSKLSSLLNTTVHFSSECVGKKAEEKAQNLKKGEVLLLENLRFHKEETDGDLKFAEALSRLGHIYVNDAFGTAHRAHASTTIVAQFFNEKKCFGYVMSKEIENIDLFVKGAKRPITAIIGGAKVSSKISIISTLLKEVDNLIIGGGMAYTFVKAQGGNVGNSLVEDDKLDLALNIIKEANNRGVRLCIPTDSVNADRFSNDANKLYSLIGNVPAGFMGLDIGHETASGYKNIIENSQSILWNGPMGVFEMDNFSHGTKAIAESLVSATQKGAFTIVGGGDSVAAINKYNMTNKVSYVSTGGGAMLEYLEGNVLPGIQAILE